MCVINTDHNSIINQFCRRNDCRRWSPPHIPHPRRRADTDIKLTPQTISAWVGLEGDWKQGGWRSFVLDRTLELFLKSLPLSPSQGVLCRLGQSEWELDRGGSRKRNLGSINFHYVLVALFRLIKVVLLLVLVKEMVCTIENSSTFFWKGFLKKNKPLSVSVPHLTTMSVGVSDKPNKKSLELLDKALQFVIDDI